MEMCKRHAAKIGPPSRVWELMRQPWKPAAAFLARMKVNFGWRFCLILVSAYFGVKGALYTFAGLVQLPYYKSLGVSGRDYQIYGSIAVTPFSLKVDLSGANLHTARSVHTHTHTHTQRAHICPARRLGLCKLHHARKPWRANFAAALKGKPWHQQGLVGTLSDTVPLFGWHKNSYILVVAVLGGFSFVLLGLMPLTAAQSACLFFLVSVETSVVDLLCEGKYAEQMRAHPETGSDLVSWVWGSYHLGALMAACITGPVADSGDTRIIFWVCLPIALQIMVPTALGYLHDARLPRGSRGARWDKLQAHGRVFSLAVLMALCALVQAGVNLVFRARPVVQMLYTLGVAILLCWLSRHCLPPRLASCNLFMFLDAALYVQIGGALDYWYTADNDCVIAGPNFDYTYYSTYVRIVAAIASCLGVVLFQTVMAGWKLRRIFWVSVLLRCAGGVFDVIIVQRWNIALGISDKAMYMVGDAIIYDICYTLNFMPAVLLTSKLCPKDLESTTYALLAGFQNFGQQVARTLGVALITLFDIRTEAPCKWEGLSALIAVAHMILPLILVPLTFVLLPAVDITVDLLDHERPAGGNSGEGAGREGPADGADDGVMLIERRRAQREGEAEWGVTSCQPLREESTDGVSVASGCPSALAPNGREEKKQDATPEAP